MPTGYAKYDGLKWVIDDNPGIPGPPGPTGPTGPPSPEKILAGDVTGHIESNTLYAIESIPITPSTPNPGDTLIFDGTNLVWQQGGSGAAITIISFTTPINILELNNTLTTPTFNSSYSSTPTSVSLYDTDNITPVSVSTANPGSFASTHSFTKSVHGNSVTFTIIVNKYSSYPTATTTVYWGQKIYYGVSTSAGPYNEAFIKALSNSNIQLNRNSTFTVNASGSNYIFYSFRSGYGTPTFTVGGFVGGFSLVSSAVSVTNAYGAVDNYDVYRSNVIGLGNTTVEVS